MLEYNKQCSRVAEVPFLVDRKPAVESVVGEGAKTDRDPVEHFEHERDIPCSSR
jgi:hypothetical protein